MSSMMPIRLAICFMASTVSLTASPPSTASLAALLAMPSVTWALSVFWLMLALICSMEALVSSMLEACSLLDWLMDWAVALTCSAALERLSDAPRTSVTILVSETMVWLRGVLGGAKHSGVVGLDLLGQVASGQGLHHPDHVVEAGIDHLSDAIDALSQGLEEAILAGQVHATVQFAV
jgi:hypothetical protein